MKRTVIACAVAGLGTASALLLAQTPAGRGTIGGARRSFEKFTVEGQPIDKRPPELDVPWEKVRLEMAPVVNRATCGEA